MKNLLSVTGFDLGRPRWVVGGFLAFVLALARLVGAPGQPLEPDDPDRCDALIRAAREDYKRRRK